MVFGATFSEGFLILFSTSLVAVPSFLLDLGNGLGTQHAQQPKRHRNRYWTVRERERVGVGGISESEKPDFGVTGADLNVQQPSSVTFVYLLRRSSGRGQVREGRQKEQQ